MNQRLLSRNVPAVGITGARVVDRVILLQIARSKSAKILTPPKPQRIGVHSNAISSLPRHIPCSAAGSEPLEPPPQDKEPPAGVLSTTDEEEPVKPVVLGVRISFEDVYYYINVVYWSLLLLSVLLQHRYLEAVSHFRNFVTALSLASSAFAGWHALRWYQDVRNHLGSSERKKDFQGLMKYGWRAAFWLAFTLWYVGPTVDIVTEYTGTPGAIMCLYGLALAGSAALMAGSWSFFGDPHVPKRLVTGGPYALLRHPQALGNMLFLVGFSLTGGALLSALAFVASFTLYCIAVVPREEAMLENTFHSKYRHWKERVPRLSTTSATLTPASIEIMEYWKSVLLGNAPLNEQTKVAKDLVAAAISVRQGRDQTLFPDEAISLFRRFYLTLDDAGKMSLFQSLASNFSIDIGAVDDAVHGWQKHPRDRQETALRAAQKLWHASQPMYSRLWQPLSQQKEGLSFLVDLRGDLLQCVAQSAPKQAPPLRAMAEGLRRLLAGWFTVGLLKLERVTWEESSAALLEKVAVEERVHRIDSWEALKRRLASDRRVFVWKHPSLPEEPLVALHVALCDSLASSMNEILEEKGEYQDSISMSGGSAMQSLQIKNEDEALNQSKDFSPTAAIFYSISSMKPGLAGVDLGNNLIKAAAKELCAESPSLHTLATLSPLPGFAAWLESRMARISYTEQSTPAAATAAFNNSTADKGTDNDDDLAPFLLSHEIEELVRAASGSEVLEIGLPVPSTSNHLTLFRWALHGNRWLSLPSLERAIKTPLLRLAAQYLVREKHRGRALDPVANFHLRNGASVHRLNWAADTSAAGLERSHGIMVNYAYDLDRVEENNRKYLVDGEVAVTHEVLAMLEQ